MRPAVRLSAFYAAIFLVVGVQTPFWPVWLAGRGLAPEEIAALFAAAIWIKVIAAPVLGALADRLGRRRAVMTALAGIAVCGYAALWPATAFWALLGLSVLAMAAQSALMPLGDTLTLAATRGGGVDYGRVRVWGSISFIAGSLGAGVVLGLASSEIVLPLVAAASLLVFLACRGMPEPRHIVRSPDRRAGLRLVLGDRRFWLFIAAASALQASHQVYYGFGTSTGARSDSRTRRSAGSGRRASSPKSRSSGKPGASLTGLAQSV